MNVPGVSERDRSRFTTGDCHYLARAIQKRTGWPIFCFLGEWALMGIADGPVTHAFIQLPDGRFLDVHGVQSKAEIRRRWREQDMGCFTWAEIRGPRGFWGGPFGGRYTYQRAGEVAEILLGLSEVAALAH